MNIKYFSYSEQKTNSQHPKSGYYANITIIFLKRRRKKFSQQIYFLKLLIEIERAIIQKDMII